ncbi:MAG: ankyrin repeat domain-containing protein [Candidatus Xenobiia bacterium LiM19]
MSLYCSKCGEENTKESSKFCFKCGEELEFKAKYTANISTVGTTIIQNPKLLDNRYEIIATIKAGAMGCVFKAKDTRLDNIVAVKQMLSSFTNPQDSQYAETRFKEEAKMLSALHHGGLPKVIDYFTVREPSAGKTLHYLVMTFIEGKDLETIIHERGQKPFTVDEVMNYFRQILDILDYLHTQSSPIVYRDLNPRNIMVQKGKLFLIDFGIARLFTPQQKGTAIGTAGYAAPEQYKGAAEPRSDIFSLGVVLHYLLTGKDPEDSSHSNLFSFEQVKKLNPFVPEHLDSLIMSMVDIVLDNRPQNIESIKKRLDRTSQSIAHNTQKPKAASKKHKVTPQTVNTMPKVIKNDEDEKYSNIFRAIEANDLQAMKDFLKKNPSLININDNIGRSPIHCAAGLGHLGIVEILISQGADNNAKDNFGYTPLHCAAKGGYIKTVELLISQCADINERENLGLSPLHWASAEGNIEVAKLLISKGANVNAKDNRGWTPLNSASHSGYREIAKLLISKGARYNDEIYLSELKGCFKPLFATCGIVLLALFIYLIIFILPSAINELIKYWPANYSWQRYWQEGGWKFVLFCLLSALSFLAFVLLLMSGKKK